MQIDIEKGRKTEIKLDKADTTYICPYASGDTKYEYKGSKKKDVALISMLDIRYRKLFFASPIEMRCLFKRILICWITNKPYP